MMDKKRASRGSDTAGPPPNHNDSRLGISSVKNTHRIYERERERESESEREREHERERERERLDSASDTHVVCLAVIAARLWKVVASRVNLWEWLE